MLFSPFPRFLDRFLFTVSTTVSWYLHQTRFLLISLSRSLPAYSQRQLVLIDQEYYFTDLKSRY